MARRLEHLMVVGPDRALIASASAVAERVGYGFTQALSARDGLRHLARVTSLRWTVIVPVDPADMDATVFVAAAHDLLPEATIVVVGLDPVSARAAQLVMAGASRCVSAPDRLDHPSLSLGRAA